MNILLARLAWVGTWAAGAESAAVFGAYRAWYVPYAVCFAVGMSAWAGRLGS